jgi:hypothetical protein
MIEGGRNSDSTTPTAVKTAATFFALSVLRFTNAIGFPFRYGLGGLNGSPLGF